MDAWLLFQDGERPHPHFGRFLLRFFGACTPEPFAFAFAVCSAGMPRAVKRAKGRGALNAGSLGNKMTKTVEELGGVGNSNSNRLDFRLPFRFIF